MKKERNGSSNDDMKAKTPSGATLGNRITIDGEPGLCYKQGRHEDNLTIKKLVEIVTGRPVEKIVYQK